jgi:hypothetical protein
MWKESYWRRALAIAVGLACASASGVALATHAWANYHWARTTAQFTLKLGNNLTSADWQGHLTQASSDWNNNGNTPLLTAIVAGNSTTKRCAMLAGTTQVCNSKYGANGCLGLATINVNGDHITQGSAKMNDTYFNTATYNNPNEREHVMCQEVAHTFGLDHQSTDGSSLNTCMDYFSNTGANAGSTLSTRPNAHDFEELYTIYTHLDSTTTVAALTQALQAAQGRVELDISDDPASWGQLRRQSADGRSSTYERYNADGSYTVTHVYWTMEAVQTCPACDHRRDHGGR